MKDFNDIVLNARMSAHVPNSIETRISLCMLKSTETMAFDTPEQVWISLYNVNAAMNKVTQKFSFAMKMRTFMGNLKGQVWRIHL